MDDKCFSFLYFWEEKTKSVPKHGHKGCIKLDGPYHTPGSPICIYPLFKKFTSLK